MAYARFSAWDVYVFMHVDGHLECCGCRLNGGWEGGVVECESTEAMIAHLAEHEAAGHDVPPGIEDQLREDNHANFGGAS